MATKLDLEQLRTEIRLMTRATQLYKALKEELESLGYWKNRPRGDPRKAYQASLKNKTVNVI